ncbi:MAG: hypothetical protein ABSC94_31625 [Polyangiaceae bacterium]|jgi:hypothetical protein
MATQIRKHSPAAPQLFMLAAHGPGVDRARYAVDLALRCLGSIEPAKNVRDLVDRAEGLRDEMKHWSTHPPSSERRETVMRGALSIQMAALNLLRKSR